MVYGPNFMDGNFNNNLIEVYNLGPVSNLYDEPELIPREVELTQQQKLNTFHYGFDEQQVFTFIPLQMTNLKIKVIKYLT